MHPVSSPASRQRRIPHVDQALSQGQDEGCAGHGLMVEPISRQGCKVESSQRGAKCIGPSSSPRVSPRVSWVRAERAEEIQRGLSTSVDLSHSLRRPRRKSSPAPTSGAKTAMGASTMANGRRALGARPCKEAAAPARRRASKEAKPATVAVASLSRQHVSEPCLRPAVKCTGGRASFLNRLVAEAYERRRSKEFTPSTMAVDGREGGVSPRKDAGGRRFHSMSSTDGEAESPSGEEDAIKLVPLGDSEDDVDYWAATWETGEVSSQYGEGQSLNCSPSSWSSGSSYGHASMTSTYSFSSYCAGPFQDSVLPSLQEERSLEGDLVITFLVPLGRGPLFLEAVRKAAWQASCMSTPRPAAFDSGCHDQAQGELLLVPYSGSRTAAVRIRQIGPLEALAADGKALLHPFHFSSPRSTALVYVTYATESEVEVERQVQTVLHAEDLMTRAIADGTDAPCRLSVRVTREDDHVPESSIPDLVQASISTLACHQLPACENTGPGLVSMLRQVVEVVAGCDASDDD
eukprot:TRINITY_DN5117_c0_g1_i1.p1 TRINITY_DN5117_c0_g1~~TRINITY_DN5117_c0_g1_i1.p1  ORF type:complete len:520 (+),score=81.55 TRINITY_DN5117_c0_g1_i1:116-1675(+)